MRHRQLVVPVALLQKRQVPLVAILPLPALDLVLHSREIRAEAHALAVAEPDVVVGVAFEQLDALGFEARAQLAEGQVEEAREQEQRGPLVEAVAFVVDQAAAPAGEGVLFEDGDAEAGFGEACGGCYAAYAGAWMNESVSGAVVVINGVGGGFVAYRSRRRSSASASLTLRGEYLGRRHVCGGGMSKWLTFTCKPSACGSFKPTLR